MENQNNFRFSLTAQLTALIFFIVSSLLPSSVAVAQVIIAPEISPTDTPFPSCESTLYMAQNDNNAETSSFGKINLLQTIDFTKIEQDLSPQYNAMAFNDVDNFIYSLPLNPVTAHADILRIGIDGIAKLYREVIVEDDLGVLDWEFNAAEFYQGRMYFVGARSVTHGGGTGYGIYSVEVGSAADPLIATYQNFIPRNIYGENWHIADIAYYNGAMWSVATRGVSSTDYVIIKYDINLNTVVAGPIKSGDFDSYTAGTFTSMFGGSNGVYGYNTNTATAPSGVKNFVQLVMPADGDVNGVEVRGLASAPPVAASDGAKCANSPLGLPADVRVDKVADRDRVRPDEAVNFSISVVNDGPWGVSDIEFEDLTPAEIQSVNWTCTPKSARSSCSPASGTGDIRSTLNLLDADEYVIFDVAMLTSPDFGGVIENTATITVPEDFLDSADNNTVTVTVGKRPEPMLVVTKESGFDLSSDNGNGLPDPGEALIFSVTVENTGEVEIEGVYPIDDGPIFGGLKGTGILQPFEPAAKDLAPGQSETFRAIYHLTEADIAAFSNAPELSENIASAAGYLQDNTLFDAVDPAVAPIVLPSLNFTKQAELLRATRGGVVPYLIEIEPIGLFQDIHLSLEDVMPVGFDYVPNSLVLNGVRVEPTREGRALTVPVMVSAQEKTSIHMLLAISAAVQPGKYENIAMGKDPISGKSIGNVARAEVEVSYEAVFDCAEIIGAVFDDLNRNGYQDDGEAGIASARILDTTGKRFITDAHGRFHAGCADVPNHRIGANFMLKLDPRSLPTGYRILSENPRSVRVTAGKMSQLNFATSIARVVRIDVNDDAFAPGGMEIRQEFLAKIERIIDVLLQEESVLRISYIGGPGSAELMGGRIENLKERITSLWQTLPQKYDLNIEVNSQIGGT